MLQTNTLRAMISRLLQVPGYTVAKIAKRIGVHEETIRKVQFEEAYQLIPAKQLALIKLYCAERATKQ